MKTNRLCWATSKVAWALLVSAIIIPGCKGEPLPSMQEVAAPYAERLEALPLEFKTIAESFPAGKEFNKLPPHLQPTPYYHVLDGQSNTGVMSLRQLEYFPGLDMEDEYFEIGSTRTLERLIDHYYSVGPADPKYALELAATVDLRYIIVYDSDTSKLPSEIAADAAEETPFVPHPLELFVTMYDRQQGEWLLAETVLILPPEELDFSYDYRRPYKEQAQSALDKHRVKYAGRAIADLIEERTDSWIEFNSREYRRDGKRGLVE